jgi:hypothetical protein
MKAPQKALVRAFIFDALKQAQYAQTRENQTLAWHYFQQAHIASQPFAILHFKVHAHMLIFAIQTRNLKEIWGQFLRIILAIPGSVTGKYPKGNPGTSDVSMFQAFEN